jgi:hypothetical protein
LDFIHLLNYEITKFPKQDCAFVIWEKGGRRKKTHLLAEPASDLNTNNIKNTNIYL